MPLIVLLLIATATGVATWLVVARLRLAKPRPDGPAEVAREIGREAGRRPALRSALRRRFDPAVATGLALTVALGFVALGGVLLGVLTYLIRSNEALARIDRSVARWGYDHSGTLSTHGLDAITMLGATWLVVVLAVALGLTETLREKARWAIPFLVVVVLGNNLLTTAVKDLVDRVRPDLNPLAASLGPSFPSGHSSTAAAFYAAAAFLIGRRCGRSARSWLAAAAVAIAVGVACSRVFLDVHWLSDVIAGLTLGWLWFAVCVVAFGGRLLRFGAAAEEIVAGAAESPEAGADTSRLAAR